MKIQETPQTVQYFDHVKGQLKHSQEHKAKKFIEHDCIVYDRTGIFYCGPIPGYNSRTYSIQKQADGTFACNCQGFRKRELEGEIGFCSHIAALIKWFEKRKQYEKALDGYLSKSERIPF